MIGLANARTIACVFTVFVCAAIWALDPSPYVPWLAGANLVAFAVIVGTLAAEWVKRRQV